MWAFPAAAGGGDLGWLASIIVGLLSLAGAAIAAVTSLRSSGRKVDADRETELEQQISAEMTRLRADNDTLRTARDRYFDQRNAAQEEVAALRRWIRDNGGNPDEILHTR